jgi:hypothetical protein
MKSGSKTVIFILFLLAGIVVGGFLGALGEKYSFLAFLSYGQSFGIETVKLNLGVVALTFGLSLKLNIAVIISIFLAFIFYKKFA